MNRNKIIGLVGAAFVAIAVGSFVMKSSGDKPAGSGQGDLDSSKSNSKQNTVSGDGSSANKNANQKQMNPAGTGNVEQGEGDQLNRSNFTVMPREERLKILKKRLETLRERGAPEQVVKRFEAYITRFESGGQEDKIGTK